MPMIQYEDVRQRARAFMPTFAERTAGTPYEEKGILYSEILFMLAAIEGWENRRILESGRARGQSTLVLARSLPHVPILSIEYDSASPDVLVAEKRLSGIPTVTLRYGDAIKILPHEVQAGDVVIIDGPKMFAAIRLALTLLATGAPVAVFVHDVAPGTPERAFLTRWMPEARYSDFMPYAREAAVVDVPALHTIPADRRLEARTDEWGYGYTLALLPYLPGRNYRMLSIVARVYDISSRILAKLSRFRT